MLPLLGAAVMVAAWPLASDGDLYLHLKLGQLIAQNHALNWTDVFTYSAAGRPEETHAWLSQLLFWLLYRGLGELGLRVLNFLIVAGILALCVRYGTMHGHRMGLSALAATLALLVHHEVQTLRPLLFGEFFFSLFLFEFFSELRPLRGRRLAACVALTVLWTNLHASVLGILPFAALHALGLTLKTRKPAPLLVPTLLAMSTWINPRGWRLWSYAWHVTNLGHRLQIGEWRANSPFHWNSPSGYFVVDFTAHAFLLALGLGACLILLARRPLRFRSLISLILLMLPLTSFRHTAYLVFPLTVCVIELGERLRLPAEPWITSAICLSLLLAFRVQESPMAVPKIERAARFIDETGLRGNAFNYPGWGSYLAFSLYPKLRVAHTMRLEVQEALLLQERQAYETDGGIRLADFLQRLPETDLAILPSWFSVNEIFSSPEWAIVFENNVATIALRRNARNAENFHRLSEYYRELGIPFDAYSGVRASELARRAPAWWHEVQEPPGWGLWPRAEVKERWFRHQKGFYDSRKLPLPDLS